MHARHAKMIGIFLMLMSLLFCVASYLFVAFHYHHVWSLFCNAAFLFAVLVTPAVCFGYNSNDPVFILKDTAMTEETYRNWRDCGFVTAAVLYLVTFLLPVVAWFATNGRALTMGGVIIVYFANVCYSIAYMAWYKIFILDSF
jgi:hypothetical protein